MRRDPIGAARKSDYGAKHMPHIADAYRRLVAYLLTRCENKRAAVVWLEGRLQEATWYPFDPSHLMENSFQRHAISEALQVLDALLADLNDLERQAELACIREGLEQALSQSREQLHDERGARNETRPLQHPDMSKLQWEEIKSFCDQLELWTMSDLGSGEAWVISATGRYGGWLRKGSDAYFDSHDYVDFCLRKVADEPFIETSSLAALHERIKGLSFVRVRVCSCRLASLESMSDVVCECVKQWNTSKEDGMTSLQNGGSQQ
jgi:hypothetical protein